MKFYHSSIALLVTLLLVSCSSTGKSLDLDLVKQQIKIGESNTNDVLAVCGEPLLKDSDYKSDTEMWHYAFVKKNVTAFGVFTHVTGFGSETKSEKRVLDVYFTKGIVSDIQTESASTTKMHLQ